jgi:tetratricopeptide (TPR) repeat protein
MAAQNDLDTARQALERGDLLGATRHVASVLGEDPNRSDALGVLDEIIATADDPSDLLPSDDLPVTSSLQAVAAYILASQGEVAEAIDKLLGVINERPDVLYIDWLLGWLNRPEAAGRLDMEKLSGFVGGLIEQLPALTSAHGGGRDTLTRMPPFIQLIRRTQPADSHFLAVAASMLGRLGLLDEGLRLAREANAMDPSPMTAGTLASTLAARGEIEPALQAYRDALERDPTDLSTRCNMADLLVHSERVKEALEVYADILERDPTHENAQPAYYFLRFTEAGDDEWRDKLMDLAESQPENERAQRLARQATPFLGYLPDPPDLTSNLRPTGEDNRRVSLPYVEPPSNYLAYDWMHRLSIRVTKVQKPDPRLPRGRVDYLLWRYDGDTPRVAMSSPAPDAANGVAGLATQHFSLEGWWGLARRLARQLGPKDVNDLLATMVHPPGAGRMQRPAAWVYRVQMAAALTLAHIDGGWEDSVRRRALLSLANGPMDWTVDAALVALSALARDEEDAAPEILRLFRQLRADTPADGTFSFYPVLLWCTLRLPDLPDDDRSEVRERLRVWRDARKAEHHYRQALGLLEKGDLDSAVEGLTESLRLNPRNAEAFRARGNLALKRSKAQQAIEDFTEALKLQPGMAEVYLGRGDAYLKLRQLEQAIGDFSEAVRLTPWDWQSLYKRGLAQLASKRFEQAVADFNEAIRLAPEQPEAYRQRAVAHVQLGQLERAIEDYSGLIRLNPKAAQPYSSRARLRLRKGEHAAAVADHLAASELDPGNASTFCDLAWIWATTKAEGVRDGKRALEAARKACELTDWKKAECLIALAAAHAELGRFDEAVQWATQAVELARESDRTAYQGQLECYRRGEPWHEG